MCLVYGLGMDFRLVPELRSEQKSTNTPASQLGPPNYTPQAAARLAQATHHTSIPCPGTSPNTPQQKPATSLPLRRLASLGPSRPEPCPPTRPSGALAALAMSLGSSSPSRELSRGFSAIPNQTSGGHAGSSKRATQKQRPSGVYLGADSCGLHCLSKPVAWIIPQTQRYACPRHLTN